MNHNHLNSFNHDIWLNKPCVILLCNIKPTHSHSERVDLWRTVSDFCFSFWRKRVPLRCIFRRMGFSTSYNVTLWRGTRWLHIETLWAFISHWPTEDLALLFSTQGFFHALFHNWQSCQVSPLALRHTHINQFTHYHTPQLKFLTRTN